ncbi:MAG: flagellar biosynthesis protein FlhA [Rickettsiaceae bacterium]|nr:flagellar biosynthesis protein FlhA [Rickettsiaceae bacterium]
MVKRFLEIIGKYSEFILAISIIFILIVLLFPVPTPILDILLSLSITISIIILMTTLFISKPLELSVFPTILLVTTMLRLSLNIASTRLILAKGHTGPNAAGHIIEAFGHFVMQGNVVIGLIVFMILTIINFIVITKGSGRIAEVAARFSLDALPGKQMAIDADLSAGLIDEAAAKSRRKELEDENTFYGAMDGANKFVRGDAIAGLIITFINLVGGVIIGVVQRSLSLEQAAKTYTILTIGDGLVSQIPSLVISLAAGLLVTKSGVAGSADKAIFGQLSKYPQPLFMTSLVTGMLAFVPGLPFLPFFVLSGVSGGSGYLILSLKNAQVKLPQGLSRASLGTQGESSSTDISSSDSTGEKQEEKPSDSLQIEQIKIELGFNLLQLVNYSKGHKLTDQIKAIRKQMAKDFGFVMPSIRIQDNLQLSNDQYIIKIKEIECGRGEIRVDKLLVMDPKGEEIKMDGEVTKEPTFGIAAKWIDESLKGEAQFNNLTVVDPPTILTTHVTELVKEYITELLSYTAVQRLLDDIQEDNKKLVKDVVPDPVTVSSLQKILQNLLAERVSIRDLPTILEAASDSLRHNKSIILATEFVRARLARQLCHANTGSDGFIPVITLSPEWEQLFSNSIAGEGDDKTLIMQPSKLQDFTMKVKKIYDEQAAKGLIPIILTSGANRPFIRAAVERFRSNITVMSQNEIHPKSKIRTLGSL